MDLAHMLLIISNPLPEILHTSKKKGVNFQRNDAKNCVAVGEKAIRHS